MPSSINQPRAVQPIQRLNNNARQYPLPRHKYIQPALPRLPGNPRPTQPLRPHVSSLTNKSETRTRDGYDLQILAPIDEWRRNIQSETPTESREDLDFNAYNDIPSSGLTAVGMPDVSHQTSLLPKLRDVARERRNLLPLRVQQQENGNRLRRLHKQLLHTTEEIVEDMEKSLDEIALSKLSSLRIRLRTTKDKLRDLERCGSGFDASAEKVISAEWTIKEAEADLYGDLAREAVSDSSQDSGSDDLLFQKIAQRDGSSNTPDSEQSVSIDESSLPSLPATSDELDIEDFSGQIDHLMGDAPQLPSQEPMTLFPFDQFLKCHEQTQILKDSKTPPPDQDLNIPQTQMDTDLSYDGSQFMSYDSASTIEAGHHHFLEPTRYQQEQRESDYERLLVSISMGFALTCSFFKMKNMQQGSGDTSQLVLDWVLDGLKFSYSALSRALYHSRLLDPHLGLSWIEAKERLYSSWFRGAHIDLTPSQPLSKQDITSLRPYSN